MKIEIKIKGTVIFLNFLIVLIAFGCGTSKHEKKKNNNPKKEELNPNVLSPAEVAGGWELLFDGKKNIEWRGYNVDTILTEGWTVDEAGNLVVESNGGDIITKRKFKNFDLKIDFLLSDLSNSGIFYRVSEKKDTSIWCNAIEYQLIDDQVFEHSKNQTPQKHLTGDVYDLYSCNNKNKVVANQWHQARIVVLNNYVEHWLDGELILEYRLNAPKWQEAIAHSKFQNYPDFSKNTFGNIGLQGQGKQVKFRNIKIKVL